MLVEFFAGCDGESRPFDVLFHSLHEFVGDPDGKIRILEHYAVIGFDVVLAGVTCLDERPGFLLFFGLAGNELPDVRMGNFQRLHLCSAAGLAAGLDDRGYLVIDPHKTQRPRRLTAP